MCEQAGREGKFTNRSLRASAATALFQSDAPEKVIQEFTGHRSVKALRQYESKQKEAACNILTGGTSASSFSAEVEKLEHPQVSETLFPNHSAISSIPMSTISPQISSTGAVNFTMNICPTGSFAIRNTCSSTNDDYYDLFEDLEFLS